MLVGRSTERAGIDALLVSAVDGRGGGLLIRGEPGIGKTALLDYAFERADGMRVLRARGVEAEAELAFSGLYELLRPVMSLTPEIPERQAAALAVKQRAFGRVRLPCGNGLHLLRGQLASPPLERLKRFASGRRDQPCTNRFRFPEPVDLGRRREPGALDDIFDVGWREPVPARRTPYSRGEPPVERVPRALVAGHRGTDEPAVRLVVAATGHAPTVGGRGFSRMRRTPTGSLLFV